ncbi:DUF2384 domain-containing protein [Candidatus Poribacteria bacterium]|nr:DUF2384 domain-containing protein [Candidatus Poribacteria bacterium]
MKPIAESTHSSDIVFFKEILDLLQRIKENSLYSSQKIQHLCTIAEQRILERLNDLAEKPQTLFDSSQEKNKDLQTFFDLSQEAFERLTSAEGGTTIEDLWSIKGLLERQFEQEEIDRWLHAPNPKFDGKTPVEAMFDGQTVRIQHLLARLEEGAHY